MTNGGLDLSLSSFDVICSIYEKEISNGAMIFKIFLMFISLYQNNIKTQNGDTI